MAVYFARVLKRRTDRLGRDLVEHHALDGDLRLECLHEVPRDRLAFAVLIGREVEFVGVLERGAQFRDRLLLVRADDVVRLEPVVDVDAELAELRLLRGGDLTRLGKVADVAHRGEHGVPLSEVAADLLGLRRGLDDHELAACSHDFSLPMVIRTPYYSWPVQSVALCGEQRTVPHAAISLLVERAAHR